MNTVKGDLVRMAKEGFFEIIVHGCNCFCNMGSGIAKLIALEFPEAKYADLQTAYGDIGKLGTYQAVFIPKYGITVINAYTQYRYGGGRRNADYEAIKRVFDRLKEEYPDKRIGIPKIGAGLAGGDWEIIKGLIGHAPNITLVELG